MLSTLPSHPPPPPPPPSTNSTPSPFSKITEAFSRHGGDGNKIGHSHSRTQSLQAFLVSGWSALRDFGIMVFLRIVCEFFDWFFCKEPIEKFKEYSKKFHYPRVSPGDQPLIKSRRNSGIEIGPLQKIQ